MINHSFCNNTKESKLLKFLSCSFAISPMLNRSMVLCQSYSRQRHCDLKTCDSIKWACCTRFIPTAMCIPQGKSATKISVTFDRVITPCLFQHTFFGEGYSNFEDLKSSSALECAEASTGELRGTLNPFKPHCHNIVLAMIQPCIYKQKNLIHLAHLPAWNNIYCKHNNNILHNMKGWLTN